MRLPILLPIITAVIFVSLAQAETEPNQNLTISSKIVSKCTCGIRNNQGTKIVGGSNAKKNEFTWRIAMFKRSSIFSSSYSYVCSGALIDSRWILTAAHCVVNTQASQLAISIGDHDLKTKSETNSEIRRVSRIIVHASYNTRSLENDIALLQLDSPVEYNKNIGPVCLPLNHAGKTFTNEKAITSGWGTMKEGSSSTPSVLQSVGLDVISNQECAKKYPNLMSNNKMCTLTPGKDACQGDSGSSLDFYDPQSKFYIIIGVVSFGTGCARRETPGVYTRVTQYTGWVQENTGAAFCKP